MSWNQLVVSIARHSYTMPCWLSIVQQANSMLSMPLGLHAACNFSCSFWIVLSSAGCLIEHVHVHAVLAQQLHLTQSCVARCLHAYLRWPAVLYPACAQLAKREHAWPGRWLAAMKLLKHAWLLRAKSCGLRLLLWCTPLDLINSAYNICILPAASLVPRQICLC